HATEALRIIRGQGLLWYVPECLELLAEVASAQGRSERAARLFGMAEVARQLSGAPIHPSNLAVYHRAVAATHVALGAAAWTSAWAEGRATSVEHAIAYALADDEPGPPPAVMSAGPPRARPADPLTPRERELALLIARGLSNRQIATEL